MHRYGQLGAFFFGGVELDDAGAGPPAPMDRRFDNDAAWRATEQYVNSATEAERLGYDSFWTTEHHFQHEGYEVVPNGIQLSTWIAARTSRLRLGTMFNVVPQWHPLRLAEDFSTLHNLSGGRAILGVGRGTVPREVLHLNEKHVSIGSHDNPDQQADDAHNREVFEEAMDVIRLALANERFSYHGTHYEFPLPGIPDRGSTVQELTLVPRPGTRTRSGRRSPARRPSSTSPSSVTAPCSGTSTTASSSASGTPTARGTPSTTTAPSWPPATSACW